MPKRVIDFDAMWASDKIAACAEWAQAEYAWLYGMADCAGCFELTNLRVTWGRVAAIRRSFSIERLEQVLNEFQDKGLLFVWNESGKRYGHWTGSDVPGRLPPPSWRNRLERLAPAVPRDLFGKYVAAHSIGVKNKSRCEALPDGTSAACGRELPGAKSETEDVQEPVGFEAAVARVERVGLWHDERSANCSSTKNISTCRPRRTRASRKPNEREWSRPEALKVCLEEPQAQDLGLSLDQEGNRERQIHTHVLQNEKSVCEPQTSSLEQKQKLFEENAKANSEDKAESKSTSFQNGSIELKPTASTSQACPSPETLLQIWQQERGPLAEVRELSPEREARCRERISHARSKGKNTAQFLADFREAVARSAATPFLCGEGPGGWRANFDWLVTNDTNYLKVIEGRYDAGAGISAKSATASSGGTGSWAMQAIARDESVRRELNAGAGPSSVQDSTRVRAGVIQRALHRE
jgi:hypothetical protein